MGATILAALAIAVAVWATIGPTPHRLGLPKTVTGKPAAKEEPAGVNRRASIPESFATVSDTRPAAR